MDKQNNSLLVKLESFSGPFLPGKQNVLYRLFPVRSVTVLCLGSVNFSHSKTLKKSRRSRARFS